MKPGIFTYILAALMLVAAFFSVQMSWNKMMSHSGTPDSVLGNSGLTAKFVDNVLCTYQSPACHTADVLIEEGWKHDVSPAMALAFLWQGSNFGKVACGVQSATCISLHDGSWRKTYADWYGLIEGPLFKGSGVVSVQEIVAKAGAPKSFAENITKAVKLWDAGTVGVPS